MRHSKVRTALFLKGRTVLIGALFTVLTKPRQLFGLTSFTWSLGCVHTVICMWSGSCTETSFSGACELPASFCL